MRWIGGELVPEAVEINALATSHQALHVGPAEAEMPEQRILQNVVPWPDARHWRIHHHEARGATLVCCGEGEGHHVADVVADYIGLANVQRVEHTSDVFGLVLFGEAVGSGCRQAHAPQVRRDDRVIAHQFRGERRPHVAGIAVAVQQHDRRARAADPDMNRRAVRGDRFGAKSRGVGEALSLRRGRSED